MAAQLQYISISQICSQYVNVCASIHKVCTDVSSQANRSHPQPTVPTISYPSLEEQPPAYEATTVGQLIDLGTELQQAPQAPAGTDTNNYQTRGSLMLFNSEIEAILRKQSVCGLSGGLVASIFP